MKRYPNITSILLSVIIVLAWCIVEVLKDKKSRTASSNFITSRAISDSYRDGLHKFIRSAQLRFKVKALPEVTNIIKLNVEVL